MLIIDGFFGKVWVYLLVEKSQAFTKFQEWITLVETETTQMLIGQVILILEGPHLAIVLC